MKNKTEPTGHVFINDCEITIKFADRPVGGTLERICSILTDSYYERLKREPEDEQSDGFF